MTSLCLSVSGWAAEPYAERYRPQFHFSPAKGWIGDPNGLIRYRGEYHVFWWGHAVSRDLVRWRQLPHPMAGDDGSFKYFSGSVVVDESNASGFGDGKTPPMLAIYTARQKSGEDQRISVSRDHRTFHYHGPVLPALTPAERDPDVFWHQPTRRWVMATTVPERHQIRLYSSADLKSWTFMSAFGPLGARTENWEVPNLFEMPLERGGGRWVMLCGMGPNKAQYFTGGFDGREFTPDKETLDYLARAERDDTGREHALWVDWGSDFYAARVFRDLDRGGRTDTWIAWMGNWEYANRTPTSWGRGALSIPRRIRLVNTADGPRIRQRPHPALQSLRGEPHEAPEMEIRGNVPLPGFTPSRNSYELDAEFQFEPGSGNFGLELCAGPSQRVRLGYDPAASRLFLDRRESGDVGFSPRFPAAGAAPLQVTGGRVRFHVFVDQSSIEVFVNDGEAVMTSLIFPDPEGREIHAFSDSAGCRLKRMKAWPLNSIWKEAAP